MADDVSKVSALTGPRAASARSVIDAFAVMDVMREANARQASGADIIHMEVGQPGTRAPKGVREAAKRAIDRDTLGYTDALGLPELRARIAMYYASYHGLDVAPSRIVVTTGSSAGFILAFLALLDPGERIVLPEPGYPCYRQIARVLGLEPVFIPARAESAFRPGPEALTAILRYSAARAVLMASPANPTGTVIPPHTLQSLIEVTEAAGAWFISDEIYHGLTYGAPAATALQTSHDAIVINSFSKYYSMTGWRIGWMVVPERLVRTLERLIQNLSICAPAISQQAAIAAFDATDELEDYKAVYARNRDMLLAELPSAGFGRMAPAGGAFYLYADVSEITGDSEVFVRTILNETGVAITPGIDFDRERGREFVRFSYSGTFERMREAARRLNASHRVTR